MLISRVVLQRGELRSACSNSSAAVGDKKKHPKKPHAPVPLVPLVPLALPTRRRRPPAGADPAAAPPGRRPFLPRSLQTPEKRGTSSLGLLGLLNESALILRCANPTSRSCCRLQPRPLFIQQVTAAQGKSTRSRLFTLCPPPHPPNPATPTLPTPPPKPLLLFRLTSPVSQFSRRCYMRLQCNYWCEA